MILRRPAGNATASGQLEGSALADPWGHSTGWESRAPLRWRLSLTTGLVVAVAVILVTLATYASVSALLTAEVDRDLEEQAVELLTEARQTPPDENLPSIVEQFRRFHPRERISLTTQDWAFSYGENIPVGGKFQPSGSGVETSVRTIGGERVVVKRHSSGVVVAVAKDMVETRRMIATLGTVLVVLAAAGILLAILAGMVVSKAGLRPITRLQRAADYVTQTNDLRPIMVVGTDEMAQLTVSFNNMLAALQESRTRQSQFVADAGHELKTPLTSMRTNIELLMMVNQPGNTARISEQDRKDLENDVLAQMEELSTLIGDLVDLAREDASSKTKEIVELDEVIAESLARARRRRPDVNFQVRIEPWIIEGDQFSLGRAVLNLLDNAAKWSPPSGEVQISMRQISPNELRLRVDDSGPGIPVEDREKVFERFYRSAESRSTPGSGLGLAIVHQVIERHDGTIQALEAPTGGTRMEVILPGHPGEGEVEVDPALETAEADSDRREIFAERWFNQQH